MNGVAHDPKNPFPGKVWESPESPEVYHYAHKHFDYVFHNSTVDSLTKVLQGIDPGVGTRRVVESTEEDTVFLATISHGNVGYWLFTYSETDKDVLHTEDLHKALMGVKSKTTVVYFNSCFSGSMFKGVYSETGKVVALTGAPPGSVAYGCCHNETLDNMMDSCFHHNWKSRSYYGSKQQSSVTVDAEFNEMLHHIWQDEFYCEWGNLDLAKKFHLDEFQGAGVEDYDQRDDCSCNHNNRAERRAFPELYEQTAERDAMNQKIWGAFRKELNLPGEPPKIDLDTQFKFHRGVDMCSREAGTIHDVKCHRKVLEGALQYCNFYVEYKKENGFHLADACNALGEANAERIVNTLERVCASVEPEVRFRIGDKVFE